MNKYLVWVAALLVLGGCSIFEPSEEWKQAEVAEPLQIPPQLDTPGTSAEMQVPTADNTTPALVEDKSPPVLDRTLGVPLPAEQAWQALGATLDKQSDLTVAQRNADQLSYRVIIRGAELLTEADRGFFSKLMHNGPDPDRDYMADITVVGNGDKSTMQINGDALAVMHLRELLQDGLLQTP